MNAHPAPTKAMILARRPRCTRGHDLRERSRLIRNGRGYWGLQCFDCRNLMRRLARRRRWPAGLVTSGASEARIIGQRQRATRLARYGETQKSIEGRARIAHAARLRQHVVRTHCKRGHAFTPANTYRNPSGSRQCRACRALATRGRPDWITVAGGRLNIQAHDRFYRVRARVLRAAMIAAHPDKGGTSRRFIDARKRLTVFYEAERRWYAAVHLTPPLTRREKAA